MNGSQRAPLRSPSRTIQPVSKHLPLGPLHPTVSGSSSSRYLHRREGHGSPSGGVHTCSHCDAPLRATAQCGGNQSPPSGQPSVTATSQGGRKEAGLCSLRWLHSHPALLALGRAHHGLLLTRPPTSPVPQAENRSSEWSARYTACQTQDPSPVQVFCPGQSGHVFAQQQVRKPCGDGPQSGALSVTLTPVPFQTFSPPQVSKEEHSTLQKFAEEESAPRHH